MSFTVFEKNKELRMRKQEQQKIAKTIDSLVRQAEGGDAATSQGCGAGICALVARLRGQRRATRTAQVVAESSTSGATSTDFQRAVFGLAGVKSGDPASKLEQAATIMRDRIEALEARAHEQRVHAVALQKAGKKAAALRALKKAKQIEAQLASNQAALDAVEQQVDLLAQAAMQKTMTAALASTSKTMKADKKMLGKAEKAIDDATEARDMASDLNAVVGEFAQNGAGDDDDDELVAELMAMVESEPPPPADDAVVEAAKQEEIARLERKLQSCDLRAAVNAMPSAPNNGKAKVKEEKAGLLASQE